MKNLPKSISFIIPIYNEENKLKKLLREILKFKKKYKNIKSEFILVNDGSKDNTGNMLKNLFNKQKFIKILNLKKNYGKGYALKKGVFIANNELIITIDADLSVKFNQIFIWQNNYNISGGNEVYFASRNHKLSKVKFKVYRKLIGLILSVFIYLLVDKKLRDTQCGFKLYSYKIGKKIFKKLNIKGFSHDIEIIFLLKKMKVKILELPINWTHKSGSKVNLFIEPIYFILIIIFLKFKYSLI